MHPAIHSRRQPPPPPPAHPRLTLSSVQGRWVKAHDDSPPVHLAASGGSVASDPAQGASHGQHGCGWQSQQPVQLGQSHFASQALGERQGPYALADRQGQMGQTAQSAQVLQHTPDDQLSSSEALILRAEEAQTSKTAGGYSSAAAGPRERKQQQVQGEGQKDSDQPTFSSSAETSVGNAHDQVTQTGSPRALGWSGQPPAISGLHTPQNRMPWGQPGGQQTQRDCGLALQSSQSGSPSLSDTHLLRGVQPASGSQGPGWSGTEFQQTPDPASGAGSISQQQAQGGLPPPPPAMRSELQGCQPGFSLSRSSHGPPPPPPPRSSLYSALPPASSPSVCSPSYVPAASDSVTATLVPTTSNASSISACPPPPPCMPHTPSSFNKNSPSPPASSLPAAPSSRPCFLSNPPPPPSCISSSAYSAPFRSTVPPPPSLPQPQLSQPTLHPPPPPVPGACQSGRGLHQRSSSQQPEHSRTDTASACFLHASSQPGHRWATPSAVFATASGARAMPCPAPPPAQEREQDNSARQDFRPGGEGRPGSQFSSSLAQRPFAEGGGYIPPPPPPEPPAIRGRRSADVVGLPHQTGQKRKRMEEEPMCLLCDKTFRNANKLKQHEEEEHLSCDFPECTYRGPVHVMVMHKLKHLKNEKGESLLDNEAETAAWLAARKENFPSKRRKREAAQKAKQKQSSGPLRLPPRPKSVLERILRETMTSAYGRRLIHPAFFSSAFCPNLRKMLPRPPLIYSLRRELRCAPLPPSPYTHSSGLQPSSFLVPAFGARGPGGRTAGLISGRGNGWPEVPLRPPLLYQLLAPEVREYEAVLLSAISFIVKSNFFLDTPQQGETKRLVVELAAGDDEVEEITKDQQQAEGNKSVEKAGDSERVEQSEAGKGPARVCCSERVSQRTPDCIVVG